MVLQYKFTGNFFFTVEMHQKRFDTRNEFEKSLLLEFIRKCFTKEMHSKGIYCRYASEKVLHKESIWKGLQ